MRLNYSELVHSLPHTTEFHEDITLLFELIKFSVEPEHYKLLSYQRLFQLVRLADYIGCDRFLQRVASRLGVAVPMISNANPIRKVRGLIRSKVQSSFKVCGMISGPKETNALNVGGYSLEGQVCYNYHS